MQARELAHAILKIAHLRGEFKLRSGLTSNEYFDKYRFESQPTLLREIARAMKPLVPAGTEALAGLEMGGIPVATALALETGLPVVFVRKEAKSYGTCRVAEGLESLKGLKLCVIEDVITTGGQVILSAKDLKNEGAIVEDVLCVISRQQGGEEKLAAAGLKMRSLFTQADLKSAAE
ncbi:MAG TPA: orotate phosphoribosyltransferase [Bdellovibrionales bacterium]|nr:orotate phosphoribosyltransferase [Bdellovibrionales bacterium]